MRATGIVRRVDDLGRVVIPKEIRRSMGIKEGEPLEIFLDKQQNAVCFVKYQIDPLNTEQLFEQFTELDSDKQIEIINTLNEIHAENFY